MSQLSLLEEENLGWSFCWQGPVAQTMGPCLSPTTLVEIGFLPLIALLFTNTNVCF